MPGGRGASFVAARAENGRHAEAAAAPAPTSLRNVRRGIGSLEDLEVAVMLAD
jgi:hypothetical protein